MVVSALEASQDRSQDLGEDFVNDIVISARLSHANRPQRIVQLVLSVSVLRLKTTSAHSQHSSTPMR